MAAKGPRLAAKGPRLAGAFGGTLLLWIAIGAIAALGAEEPAEDLLVRGGELYQANCAACHGTVGQGGPGPGVLAGPPVNNVDIAYVDMTLRTGRMPIPEPSVGVRKDRFTEEEREATVAWMRDRFDLPGEIPTVGIGDASRGQELYVRNCAACHGAAGDGGIAGAAVRVPPLSGLDDIAIAEATRVGPFEMPAFDEAVLDDQAIDDIVAYLNVVDATPRTAVGVKELDQIAQALFAAGLALAAGVVTLAVARARRWTAREPEGYHATAPFEPRE